MVKILNIGILGMGWVARDFMLQAILANQNINLMAVCSLHLADMHALPEGVLKFTDIGAFLDVGNMDAVYIATPNNLHRAHTERCLKAGKHVLCEKPLATSSDDAIAMIAASKESEKIFATAFDQRFHPAHLEMKRRIGQGLLGIVTQARIDYCCWLTSDWSPDNWRIDAQRAGGGAIIDLAPHGLDLLEFILDSKIEKLQLFDQSIVQDYTVDDGGVLMLRFENGLLATMHVAYNRPENLPRRRLEIIGTMGQLTAENTMGQDAGGQLTFINAENGMSEIIPIDQKTSPFVLQLQNFASQITRGAEPLRKPDDDLRLFTMLYEALNPQLEWH